MRGNKGSFHLAALHQADFEDPFLGPPTHSCENIPLAFELYEIKISVAASIVGVRDQTQAWRL
jgi:hypothetical protein